MRSTKWLLNAQITSHHDIFTSIVELCPMDHISFKYKLLLDSSPLELLFRFRSEESYATDK